MSTKHILSDIQKNTILTTLQERFVHNIQRHEGIVRDDVYTKLIYNTTALWSLYQMEQTGGEPDVIGYDNETKQYIFCDCSTESPKGRRSLCYDRAAWESRKEHKPTGNVIDTATAMGITLLTEEDYRLLQTLGNFDTKTSSRIQTPAAIRKLGGALFGDRRYDTIFVYHNGAESYYAARGFRGLLRV